MWNNYFHTLDNRQHKEKKWGEPYDNIDFLPESIFHTTKQQEGLCLE